MRSIVEYPSDEEKYFAAWVEDAKKFGLIQYDKYQPKPFPLSPKIEYISRYKKNGEPVMKHLMFGHEYQADWMIVWTDKATEIGLVTDMMRSPMSPGLLLGYEYKGLIRSVIDVKGGFQQNDRFPLNQKWVYDKHNIYVNKVIPFSARKINSCLFSMTWTPQSYWYRPMKKQQGKFLKVNCIPRTYEQFLNSKQ